MRIDSATSAGLKGFSSDTPKNSAERNTKTMTKTDQCQRARLAKGKCCNARWSALADDLRTLVAIGIGWRRHTRNNLPSASSIATPNVNDADLFGLAGSIFSEPR